MLLELQELRWREAPRLAVQQAEKLAGLVQDVRLAIQELPREGLLDLWCDPDSGKLCLNVGDWMESSDLEQWQAALSEFGDLEVENEVGRNFKKDWVKIAERPPVAQALGAKMTPPKPGALATLDKATGFQPGVIPGSPNMLTGILASGLLGAGVGYGTGWLAERMLPRDWERGKLRRTLAIMGGLGMAGAMGGLPVAMNVASGRPWYSSELLKEGSSFSSPGPWPMIDKDYLNRAVWADQAVAGRLPIGTRAATTGLLEGASALSGSSDTRWISPMDVARLTAGMGSGYISGAIVGKGLSALTGMPEETQNLLKNTGLFAGIIANLVPLAFRR